MVSRIYVEKKPGFDVEASQLAHELRSILGLDGLLHLRIFNRYDIEGVSPELLERCIPTVFSEPQVDSVYQQLPENDTCATLAVEALPGQFDQRAESASECVQLISQGERPTVRTAKVYQLFGDLSAQDIEAVTHYLVNPVETRLASAEMPKTLEQDIPEPQPVEVLHGFRNLDTLGLNDLLEERGLAMDAADLAFCQAYFVDEKRDPTITELRVIDTYWSDHCRHTTFGTHLEDVTLPEGPVKRTYERYQELRHELGRDHKPVCLMDIATIGARHLKAHNIMRGVDESEEINACTVRITAQIDGAEEPWLLLFKNETHNHPTEIEPFGGAATCIGGAIRDPLSGRAYVYQAMRVTGAADPTEPLSSTLPGKLPQRKIVTSAAAGYSSYGNQIGLATGQVSELYHPGYVAKRMEVGAVVGAVPAAHVRRERPEPGDVVVLLGGRTGRDGIGGATGSSKTQNVASIQTASAEVQKGNAPVERKLQRLFRRPEVCQLIKRCNDFGAGGVSVAVGELADGLCIDLDQVSRKYEGLDGTELAISESQERMAVALRADDAELLMDYARQENLEAAIIAHVTDDQRVRMHWRGETIVDLSRAFLASNGAAKHQKVEVAAAQKTWHPAWSGDTFEQRLFAVARDLNVCSNKGLAERFDATIGAGTVLMPFGGIHQLTPAQAMVAKLPVCGETTTVSGMAWGFNPYLSACDQFAGAYVAVVESVAKLVATGFEASRVYLSFQEYFERLRQDPKRWGKPLAAVLGGLAAQLDLGIGAIGGKDSMSGSFEDLDVPPTLISFAVASGELDRIISPEFKHANAQLVRIAPQRYEDDLRPDPTGLLAAFACVEKLNAAGHISAAATPGYGCGAEAIIKMCFGNRVGVQLSDDVDLNTLFEPMYGSFIVELSPNAALPEGNEHLVVELLGTTTDTYTLDASGETVDLAAIQEAWESGLEEVFAYRTPQSDTEARKPCVIPSYQGDTTRRHITTHIARPRVIIPVFPGTNCEYDTARAFEAAGAQADIMVIGNLSPQDVAESARELARRISSSQIVMIPGGFSGGDEPDGSAKFITAFFRSPEVCDAVRDLLQHRDGLMLGICNGFQALIKLGLVPYGDIVDATPHAPTLTFNAIGRHQSRLVRTQVMSKRSPWLSQCTQDYPYTVAISHGEGRFVADDTTCARLAEHGQIATQYVGLDGLPRLDLDTCPNGSVRAIEAITSPDGRVLGKMGHVERRGNGLYKNVPGQMWMPLFEGGVSYFA